MNDASATELMHPVPAPAAPAAVSARRREADAKQELVARLLEEAGADGLLVLDHANIAWLCGAPLCHGIADPAEWPALFFMPTQRWLLACNTDTQRMFDLHLDGLGYQLKEWPWHWGRDRLLVDLTANRKVASDRLVGDCVPLGPTLRRLRCTLTSDERVRLRDLSTKVAHAVEATARTLEWGTDEGEVAGQLAHRLVRRGLVPVQITVAADGRLAHHRRALSSSRKVEHSCVIAATAMADGLHATAARTVCLGKTPDDLRASHDVACRVVAAQAAAARPGVLAPEVMEAGRRVAHLSERDHEWRLTPPGWVTGWLPVERAVLPTAAFPLGDGWSAVWQAGVGPALVADTYSIEAMPACLTAAESWPVKRIAVSGLTFEVPGILDDA